MLKPNSRRPSPHVARRETLNRLLIIKGLIPGLKPFSDAALIVGSLAFAPNYAIHKDSDIDLLILVEPKNIKKILVSNLFNVDAWTKRAVNLFSKRTIHHFTLVSQSREVRVEFHIWNKEYQYKASRLGLRSIKRFSRKAKSSSAFHQDFSGKVYTAPRNSKKLGIGYIQEYLIYNIVRNNFVVYEPIHNLIMNPKILFTKDDRLYRNIKTLWHKLVRRLTKESRGHINLSEKNILNAMPGSWNLPPHIKRKLQKRTCEELSFVKSARKTSI